jgi:hypothetical protein
VVLYKICNATGTTGIKILINRSVELRPGGRIEQEGGTPHSRSSVVIMFSRRRPHFHACIVVDYALQSPPLSNAFRTCTVPPIPYAIHLHPAHCVKYDFALLACWSSCILSECACALHQPLNVFVMLSCSANILRDTNPTTTDLLCHTYRTVQPLCYRILDPQVVTRLIWLPACV